MTNEIFVCQYCGKVCKNKMSKVKHEHLKAQRVIGMFRICCENTKQDCQPLWSAH